MKVVLKALVPVRGEGEDTVSEADAALGLLPWLVVVTEPIAMLSVCVPAAVAFTTTSTAHCPFTAFTVAGTEPPEIEITPVPTPAVKLPPQVLLVTDCTTTPGGKLLVNASPFAIEVAELTSVMFSVEVWLVNKLMGANDTFTSTTAYAAFDSSINSRIKNRLKKTLGKRNKRMTSQSVTSLVRAWGCFATLGLRHLVRSWQHNHNRR